MRGRHVTPHRIHPECVAFQAANELCTCNDLFGYEGNGGDRAIEIACRLDGRTAAPLKGHGPDADDADRTTLPRIAKEVLEGRGFWKHSEFLKCNAGVKMRSDDRGLPPGYMDERVRA